MNKRVKVLWASIILVLLLTLASCSGASTPGSAAKGFFDAMANGNMDAAMNYLEPETAKTIKPMIEAMGGQKAFSTLLNSSGGEMPTNVHTKVLDEQINGDAATVTLQVNATFSGEAQTQQVKVECLKSGGQWYVNPAAEGN